MHYVNITVRAVSPAINIVIAIDESTTPFTLPHFVHVLTSSMFNYTGNKIYIVMIPLIFRMAYNIKSVETNNFP